LGFAWKTIYDQPLGHYVSGVITVNWKKAFSAVLHMTNVISNTAQYIIDQAVAMPEHLIKVTLATLCPPDHFFNY
jgi:hypothetical protein